MTKNRKSDKNRGEKRIPLKMVKAGAALAAVALLGFAYAGLRGPGEAGAKTADVMADENAVTWQVERRDLTISVLSPGELKTESTTEVRNELESYRQLKITWLIPEGTVVEKGDKLVELDSSEIREKLLQQRIKLTEAEQNVEQAKHDLAIAKRRLETDLLAAKNKVEIARLELEKYKKGDFEQEKRKAEADVVIAQEELKRAEDRLDWTMRLAEKNYVTQEDLEADKFAVTKSSLELETSEELLQLLQEYTYRQKMLTYETALAEAEGVLDEVRMTGEADLSAKQANLAAAQEKLALEQRSTADLERQLEQTTITAPKDGLVVYHKDRGRWGSSDSVLQVGSTVDPRQRLIDLPDFSSWMIEARVHESQIQKLREGQPAFVTLDALPDKVFEGEVAKISVLPDSSAWYRQTQEYLVDIKLKGQRPDFKPGMSGKSEIIVRELKDVLTVPIQAVHMADGKPAVYVADEAGQRIQPVEVGANNSRFVEIVSGLQEGQQVLLEGALMADSGLGARPSELASQEQRRTAGSSANEITETEKSAPAEAESSGPAASADERGERGERGAMSAEQRKRWQNMSEEERTAMRQRRQSQGGAESSAGGL